MARRGGQRLAEEVVGQVADGRPRAEAGLLGTFVLGGGLLVYTMQSLSAGLRGP